MPRLTVEALRTPQTDPVFVAGDVVVLFKPENEDTYVKGKIGVVKEVSEKVHPPDERFQRKEVRQWWCEVVFDDPITLRSIADDRHRCWTPVLLLKEQELRLIRRP